MLTLGAIGFLQPWALLGLVALPVIWWLLRFTPPRPARLAFPPFRLLLGLVAAEETPDRSPWWLTALRILAAALIITAFAEPVFNPTNTGAGQGPLLLVVDDGWAAAPGWQRRARIVDAIVAQARQADRPVKIVTTAGPASAEDAPLIRDNILAAQTMGPRPYAPARAAVLANLRKETSAATEIIWLADGIDYGDGAAFGLGLTALAKGAGVSIYRDAPASSPLWLTPARLADGRLEATVNRPAAGAARQGQVVAYALNGRRIEARPFTLDPGASEAEVAFDLPTELRNQVARLEISGTASAGAVTLLDERWRRRTVGVLSGASRENAQPLLDPLYYVTRALAPFAEIRRPRENQTAAALRELLAQRLSVLILADIGRIPADVSDELDKWINDGGMLVRFAGPRLAAGGDEFLPVGLRRGGRSLGGALSWSTPQILGTFETKGPFSNLTAPAEVTVNRQVLAEPDIALSGRVWARLADGTPLVTAAASGKGRIVLFHITANARWSNLALSGLFVDMLRKIIALSRGEVAATGGDAAPRQLRPRLMLDGYGQLAPPAPGVRPIEAGDWAKAVASAATPPGLYGPDTGPQALNTVTAKAKLKGLGDIPGSQARVFGATSELLLGPWLLLAALLALLVDLGAVIGLSGFARGQRATLAVLLAVALATALPGTLQAQQTTADAFAARAALSTRLAFVRTGDAQTDRIAQAGLRNLSLELSIRTALEPSEPVGIDIETDEIVFFPLLYWPIVANASTPSAKGLAKIDAYMKNGGTIFFDTRDQLTALPGGLTGAPSPQTGALRRILSQLDIPALEPVPAGHVLTKAFYLLQQFPGRWADGRIWVEARATPAEIDPQTPPPTGIADGVSPIIIGANDYAGAWARDLRGRAMLPVVPGGERQREIAIRVGINIVMYTLTGNYKADQVHVPALLERLGQ